MSSPNSRIAMLKEGRTYQALRPAHRQPYLDHCNSKLQLCNWHARQAMITNFRKTGYTNDEIEGVTDEFGETTPGIKSLAWEYLKSPSLESIEDRGSPLPLHQLGAEGRERHRVSHSSPIELGLFFD